MGIPRIKSWGNCTVHVNTIFTYSMFPITEIC